MAVRELTLNEGKDYIGNNALNGKTLYGLLSTRPIIGALTAGAVTLPVATYPVDDTSDFPTSGSFVVTGQTVTYTGKTATTLTGCTGGSGAISDNALVLGTTGFQVTDTMAGGVAEITGTGYARKSCVVPAPSSGIFTLPSVTWNPGSVTNWPNAVRSMLLATSVTIGAGTAIHVISFAAVDMSGVNANLVIAVTAFFQNIGGGQ